MITNISTPISPNSSIEILSQETVARLEKEKKYSDPRVIAVVQRCIQTKNICFAELKQGFSFIHIAIKNCTIDTHVQLYKKLARLCIKRYQQVFELADEPKFTLQSEHEKVDIAQSLLINTYSIPFLNSDYLCNFAEGQTKAITFTESYGKQTLALFKIFLETQTITSIDVYELMALHDFAHFLQFRKLQKATLSALKKALTEPVNADWWYYKKIKKMLYDDIEYSFSLTCVYLDRHGFTYIKSKSNSFQLSVVPCALSFLSQDWMIRHIEGIYLNNQQQLQDFIKIASTLDVSIKQSIPSLIVDYSMSYEEFSSISEEFPLFYKIAFGPSCTIHSLPVCSTSLEWLENKKTVPLDQYLFLLLSVTSTTTSPVTDTLHTKASDIIQTVHDIVRSQQGILSTVLKFPAQFFKSKRDIDIQNDSYQKVCALLVMAMLAQFYKTDYSSKFYLLKCTESPLFISEHQKFNLFAPASEITQQLLNKPNKHLLVQLALAKLIIAKVYIATVERIPLDSKIVIIVIDECNKAAHCIQTMLSLQPYNIDLFHQLAHIFEAQAKYLKENIEKLEKYCEVEKLYKKILIFEPNDPFYLYQLASTLFEKAQLVTEPTKKLEIYDEAELALRKALSLQPNEAPPYFCQLARTLFEQAHLLTDYNEKLKKYNEAEQLCRQASDVNIMVEFPYYSKHIVTTTHTHADILFEKAVLLIDVEEKLEHYIRADRLYREAYRIGYNLPQVLYKIARTLFEKMLLIDNNIQELQYYTDYEKMIFSNNDDIAFETTRPWDDTEKLKQYTEIEQLCRSALTLEENEPKYLYLLACILFEKMFLLTDDTEKQELLTEAEKLCRQVLIVDPNHLQYLDKFASILLEQSSFLTDDTRKLEKLAEATESYRKICILNPNDLYDLSNLVDTILEQAFVLTDSAKKIEK